MSRYQIIERVGSHAIVERIRANRTAGYLVRDARTREVERFDTLVGAEEYAREHSDLVDAIANWSFA